MIWFPCRSHITRELGAGGEKKTKNVFPSVHLDQVQHLRCLGTHRGLAGNTCGQPGVFGVPGAWASVFAEASQASWRGGRTRPQLTLVAGSLLATWPGDHEASTAFTWRLGARRHHLVTVTAGDRWSHQSPPIRKCPSLTASPFQLHDSARRPALGARGSRAQASHVLHGDNRRPAAGDSDLPRTAFYPVPAGASATSRPRTPAGASLGASRDVQGLCHHRHVLRRLHGDAPKPPFPAQTLGRGRCTLKQEPGFLA